MTKHELQLSVATGVWHGSTLSSATFLHDLLEQEVGTACFCELRETCDGLHFVCK